MWTLLNHPQQNQKGEQFDVVIIFKALLDMIQKVVQIQLRLALVQQRIETFESSLKEFLESAIIRLPCLQNETFLISRPSSILCLNGPIMTSRMSAWLTLVSL